MKHMILGLILSFVLIGCATTNLPPVTSNEFSFQDDEKRLWLRSEEEQEVLDESGLQYNDKKLNAYLNKVGKKLQQPEVYNVIPFKIKVLKNPYSNAFAYPNGVIYIHSGLIARIDNEAQLATLIAHEMTHATHRHQVREFRGTRNKAGFYASMQSTLGTLPAIGGLASALGEIGTKAAVSGYSQGLETESDMEGIKLMIRAGYDPREAPKLFQHLKDELKEEGAEEPFFFGSHPRLQDRIDNYQRFLKTHPSNKKGIVNRKTYRKNVANVILANAFLDLKAGRFESARRGARKYLSIRPKSSKGNYLLAEIHRQRNENGDAAQASKYYKKSIALSKKYPNSYKGLGLLYYKQGKKSKAKKAFKSYLKLSPKAADREYIKQYMAH